MGALLAQASLVEYENALSWPDRAQSVGNDYCRSAFEQPVESFMDHEFGLRVHAGGCFIENQELRIVCQGARKAYQLPLAD
jgi:hypothetical protein